MILEKGNCTHVGTRFPAVIRADISGMILKFCFSECGKMQESWFTDLLLKTSKCLRAGSAVLPRAQRAPSWSPLEFLWGCSVGGLPPWPVTRFLWNWTVGSLLDFERWSRSTLAWEPGRGGSDRGGNKDGEKRGRGTEGLFRGVQEGSGLCPPRGHISSPPQPLPPSCCPGGSMSSRAGEGSGQGPQDGCFSGALLVGWYRWQTSLC